MSTVFIAFQINEESRQIVDAIATQLLEAKPSVQIDRALLRVGCMLHDIGAYLVMERGRFVQGVRHGVIGENILRDEGFDEYPLWIAHYYKNKLNISQKWYFWQHSDKGKVNGIKGDVDFNVFNGNIEELKSLCKK